MTESKNYCVIDLKKIKTFDQMVAIESHNKRTRKTPNADKTRIWRNVDLLGPQPGTIKARAMARIKKQGKRYRTTGDQESDYYRQNAVLGIGVVLSYSHEMDRKLSKNKWALESFNWACRRWGKENILQAVLHDDEKTGHVHIIVVPMKKKEIVVKGETKLQEKLDAKGVMGNSLEFKKMHTDYAEAMAPFGLKRGERSSQRKKISQKEIYWSKLEEEEHRERKELYAGKTSAQKRETKLKKLVLKLKEKLILEYKATLEEVEELQGEIAEEMDEIK
jgi:hypothetical protein